MNLRVGIVGLPNAGKSTLFNALIGRQLSRVAEYPFTTIEPHEGTVEVPDRRLTDVALLVKPERATPAAITFIDIAGLVRGAHAGEGLGNEFLGHIREVEAIVEVVRAFDHPNAPHPLGSVDPIRDVAIVNTELILKDLETVTKREESEKEPERKAFWARLRVHLDAGKMAATFPNETGEASWMAELSLLTTKPVVYVANVAEAQLAAPSVIQLNGLQSLVVCAKLEADLLELSPLEQQQYLESLGVGQSSLAQVVAAAYAALQLITFFTIKGGREVRAWPVAAGTTAIAAAGKVHTEFAARFIKAEVIAVDDLLLAGGWGEAHALGKIRLEGRDYLVADGDVIEFKIGS